jgi:DNA polymerase-4
MTEHRTILHVDMDAFFVSVEMRRHPELVGQPVVVGGAGSRGVVAAANYEARRYGVFSAMSSSKARRLCPQAVFLSGDYAEYSKVSTQVHTIFGQFTPFIEPIALDEAFLDVTGSVQLFGDGTAIGWKIKEQIQNELDLPCSVGVATSKFIAKLASKKAKPIPTSGGIDQGHGVLRILPGDELIFLHPLPVQALWGVGPATLAKLERLGVRLVGDLVELGEETLVRAVGKAHGRHLFALANGIDDRSVQTERDLKSIGHEETFSHDITDRVAMRREIVRLTDAVSSRLRAHDCAARTLTLKIRYSNFETIARSITPGSPLASAPAMVKALDPVMEKIDPTIGIRLIGVSVSGFVEPVEQLSLLDFGGDGSEQTARTGRTSADLEREWSPASQAVDEIREKFGKNAINPASSLAATGRRELGQSPWGPSEEKPGDALP